MRFLLFLCIMIFQTSASFANCLALTRQFEKLYGIPEHLLGAIALVESGTKTQSGMSPYPWVINAQGKPYRFTTKTQAVEAFKKLKSQGIKLIDVGCMQVNLQYHPNAFQKIEDAFEPQHNIAYAAKFLKELKGKTGSWEKAVAHYHSASPVFNTPYRQKVLKVWNKLRNISTKENSFDQKNNFLATEFVTDIDFGDGIEESSTIPIKVKFSPYQPQAETVKVKTVKKEPDAVVLARGFIPLHGSGEKIVEVSYKVSKINTEKLLKKGFIPLR